MIVLRRIRRRRAGMVLGAGAFLVGLGGCGLELVQPILVENLATTSALFAREFTNAILRTFLP